MPALVALRALMLITMHVAGLAGPIFSAATCTKDEQAFAAQGQGKKWQKSRARPRNLTQPYQPCRHLSQQVQAPGAVLSSERRPSRQHTPAGMQARLAAESSQQYNEPT